MKHNLAITKHTPATARVLEISECTPLEQLLKKCAIT